MTQEALSVWRELEVRSSFHPDHEIQIDGLQSSLAFNLDQLMSAVSELLQSGVVSHLSEEDIGALATGQRIDGNLVIVAVDAEYWLHLRVEPRSAVRLRLAARREQLRRQIIDADRLKNSPPDPDASHTLQGLQASKDLLEEAGQFAISEEDWKFYGNRTMEFFVRHWQSLGPENRRERLKTLAVLTKVAYGFTVELAALDSICAEIAALSPFIQQLSETSVCQTGRERTPISKSVQHEVWRRDEGKCVQCGSQDNLGFDHIIPHAKGGSASVRNIQLLCEICNRIKSDAI